MEQLCEVLSVAFQASLTAEEARPLRFRLLLSDASTLPNEGTPNVGVLPLRFERSRTFSVEELRRLAPAVPFESALIGVYPDGDGRLALWGVAHSGPAWLATAWGGRRVVPIWTHDPIVHVTGPGQLAVRSAGKLIGGVERGALVDTTMDVFESRWLRGAFARERSEVQALHASRQANTGKQTVVQGSLIGLVSQHMLRRCTQIIRGARHGGMILFADSSANQANRPPDLTGIRLKYRFADEEPSKRYRTLLTTILDQVTATSAKPTIEWSDFATSDSPELARLEQSVFEWSRLVANLAAIDGAVVLDKSFSLVGFGAEVSTELASPPRVFRALEVEGQLREPYDIENVGTRHRAAYRFVHGHSKGLVIAVSQDGGITFVAKPDTEVVFWEQSVGR